MRILSALAAAALFCLAHPYEAGAEGTLSMHKRQRLGLLIISPATSAKGRVTQSDIQTELRQQLDRRTDFALEEISSSRVSECQGSLVCMVKRVRTDYDDSKIDRSKPFSAWLSELRAANIEYPLYLVMMTLQPDEGRPDKVTAMLINTDSALRFVHEGNDPDAIEQQILERAVVVRTPRTDVAGPTEAQDYLRRLVEVDFKNEFENSGNWEPFGNVTLRAKVTGLEIVIDEQIIGTTQPGETHIAGVPAGEHVLQLRHPEYELYRSDLVVKRGEQTTIDADVIGKSSVSLSPKQIVFWSGVGVAAIGAAVTVASLVHEGSYSDWKFYCIHTRGDANCGSGAVFWSLSAVLSGADSGLNNPNEGALLAAPLGYSMLGTGAIWSIGSELFATDDEIPWIPLATGLVAGLVSYGVSAALNGETAFDAQE
ncbi:MAG: PEGA domain-containing protein [Deltaproteobacteria bacterium]|nr:PEGA domain-containing protein [Deltaproteobacteria bacterium]